MRDEHATVRHTPSTPSGSRALDRGHDLFLIPRSYWGICAVQDFGRSPSGSLKANTADALPKFDCSLEFPIHPIPPSGAVADQANDDRTSPDFFADNRSDVAALQTVDRRADASVIEINRRIGAVGHKPKTIHLSPIFRMEAEEESPLRCMLRKLTAGRPEKLRLLKTPPPEEIP
jgi:hypothetical protein